MLVAGLLPPNAEEAYGDYSEVYTTWLRRSLPPGTDLVVHSFDVVHKMKYPCEDEIDSYDAVMITGSASSAYEDVPWINQLVEYTAWIGSEKPQIKLIGICFGHQIIARAFGGKCVFNNGKWEVGLTKTPLTDLGKRLLGTDNVTLQQMHRDHVSVMPDGFHLLGFTEISGNQGMVRFKEGINPEEGSLENIQIFAVQGHPEFVQGIISRICETRVRVGVMTQDIADDAERRKDWQNDGISILGKAVWQMLGVSA